MKIFAIWKGTTWCGPEPDVVSSAGAGSGRKATQLIEEKRSSEDATERFRGSSQERDQGMASKEVRQAAAATGNPS